MQIPGYVRHNLARVDSVRGLAIDPGWDHLELTTYLQGLLPELWFHFSETEPTPNPEYVEGAEEGAAAQPYLPDWLLCTRHRQAVMAVPDVVFPTAEDVIRFSKPSSKAGWSERTLIICKCLVYPFLFVYTLFTIIIRIRLQGKNTQEISSAEVAPLDVRCSASLWGK